VYPRRYHRIVPGPHDRVIVIELPSPRLALPTLAAKLLEKMFQASICLPSVSALVKFTFILQLESGELRCTVIWMASHATA
jgi:hypothetical protein